MLTKKSYRSIQELIPSRGMGRSMNQVGGDAAGGTARTRELLHQAHATAEEMGMASGATACELLLAPTA